MQTLFQHNKSKIEEWFQAEWIKTPAPVYGSVDVRHAGFKSAPVDMNLFPAGFNNLSAEDVTRSIELAGQAISRDRPKAKTILLIPENHTRNFFYWDNIKVLLSILQQAGWATRLGALDSDPLHGACSDGSLFVVEPIVRHENYLKLSDFSPDIILLNNDLSHAFPDLLKNVLQPILPSPALGWHQRLKSSHFQYYANVSAEFSDEIGLDPWLISPLFRYCDHVDFSQSVDMSNLAEQVEKLFLKIQKKYDEHHIAAAPFIIMKADSGTYGMAVMTVREMQDIYSLNRKKRSRMSVSKGGQPVQRVLIQEGIDTIEQSVGAVAESVLYLWGESCAGGFYRVNPLRARDENLNANGCLFKPFDKSLNECYLDSVIARLSMLAAAREVI